MGWRGLRVGYAWDAVGYARDGVGWAWDTGANGVCVCVCSFELGDTPARPGGAPRPLLVPNPRFIGLRAGARSWGDHGPGRQVSYCHAIAGIMAEREQSPRLPPVASPSRHLSLPCVPPPSLVAGDGPLAPGQRSTLGQAYSGEAKP